MLSKSKSAPRACGANADSKIEPWNLTKCSEPIVRLIEQLREKGCEPRPAGSGWTAKCPAHDDNTPSLSVSQGDDGRALAHCHAGCDTKNVCRALGLELHELFCEVHDRANGRSNHPADTGSRPTEKRTPRRFASREDLQKHLERLQKQPAVAEWTYRNHAGHEAFRVVRFEADGAKTYRPIHQTEDGWSVGDPPGLLPLYNLPAVCRAEEVLVVEGEKCVDAAAELGFAATTSAHGAKAAAKSDWSPLTGKPVVILPDADEAGERYAVDVAKSLRGLPRPASVRVLQLPDLMDGEDLADWLERRVGHPRTAVVQELRGLLENAGTAPLPEANRSRLLTRRASEIEPAEIAWLVEGLIPMGKLTLLCGDPGLGKSLLTVELAARVSRGEPLLSGSACGPPGHTLIISAEDDPADTIRPRLGLAGADLNRVSVLDGIRGGSEEDIPDAWDLSRSDELAQWVLAHPDLRLVILDPLCAYLAGADSHRDAEVRAMIHKLIALAAQHGFAVVCVSHLNKRTSASALYRAMGSIAFVAAARSVLLVAADQLEDDRRLLVQTKRNLSAAAPSLAFRVEDGPRLRWETEPVEVDLDSLLGQADRSESSRGARKEAAEWLESLLAAGPKLVSDLRSAAEKEAYSMSTLKRALKAIGGSSDQTGFGKQSTVWRLP